MIDLHAHILPGLDDGPGTIEGSLAIARAAVASGIDTMVATPHIDHHWGVDPSEVGNAVAALNERLAKERVGLTVLAGGEVTLTRLAELDGDELDGVRLGKGPYVLLETPFAGGGAFDEHAFGIAREVHDGHGLRALRDPGLDLVGIDAQVVLAEDVGEHRRGTAAITAFAVAAKVSDGTIASSPDPTPAPR